jgi:hypothetical protein
MNKDNKEALDDILKYFQRECDKNEGTPCQAQYIRRKFYKRMVDKCQTIRKALGGKEESMKIQPLSHEKIEDIKEGEDFTVLIQQEQIYPKSALELWDQYLSLKQNKDK